MRATSTITFRCCRILTWRALLPLPIFLISTWSKKNLVRSKVIAEAQINSTFGYQIFMGTRQASRDKILALAFAMRLNLRETTRLLQAGGANTLYAKSRRDAIIIFCIDREYTLIKVNQELFRLGERTID